MIIIMIIMITNKNNNNNNNNKKKKKKKKNKTAPLKTQTPELHDPVLEPHRCQKASCEAQPPIDSKPAVLKIEAVEL